MADNVVLNSGSGGDSVAADEISSVKYQRIKLIHGADGTNDGDVSTANGLPAQVVGTGLTRLTDIETNTDSCAVVGNGAAATAQRVTLANDSTGIVALTTSTASIGKLAANSGVDIGDVDVTSVTPGTTAAALGKAEDAAHASGDVGVFVLGVRRDSATSGADTDGDYAALGLDSSGRLHTNVGNTVTVTGTVTAAQATAGNLNMTEASAAAIKTAVEIMDDWDESDRAKVNPIVGQAGVAAGAGSVSATVQRVTLASDDPVTTAIQIMDDWDNGASDGASVSGDVAHDSADAGEPVKQGFKATTALSGLTLVANNDRTDGFAGVDGVQIVRTTTGLEDIVRGNASNTDGASTQVIAASGSASIKTYLTDVTLTNTSSSMIYVELKSGTTVMYTCPVPATGGFTKTFNPPLPPNAANEAWNFDASAATTTLYCSAIGFKSKV